MNIALNFHFPIALLLDQGDKIVAAAEANTAINARLPANYVSATRTLKPSSIIRRPISARCAVSSIPSSTLA